MRMFIDIVINEYILYIVVKYVYKSYVNDVHNNTKQNHVVIDSHIKIPLNE